MDMVWTVCPARLIRKPDLLAEHTDHSGETCRGVPADATARICAPSTLDLLRPAPPWGDHFDTHRPPLRRPCHSQLPAATCWSRAGEPLARSWSCNSPAMDPCLHVFIDHNEVLITQQPEQQQHEQNTDTTVYRTGIRSRMWRRFDACNALLVSRRQHTHLVLQVGPPLRGRTSPARGAAITTARPWHLPVRSWLRTSPHLIRLFVHHYDALPALTCSFHVTLPHSRCPCGAAHPLPCGTIEQLLGTLQLEQLARQLHLLCVRHRAWRVMCTRRHTRNRIDNGHLLPPAYATTLHPWKH